jgi:hypothetical protein
MCDLAFDSGMAYGAVATYTDKATVVRLYDTPGDAQALIKTNRLFRFFFLHFFVSNVCY